MCGSVGGLDAILEHSNFLNIISLGTEPPTPTPCRKLKKIPMTPPPPPRKKCSISTHDNL